MITSLGTQAVVSEADVCADNWLAALRAGREQLDEPGGVPPGASCVVAESGEVTILDAANRRRYTLLPLGAVVAAVAEPPRRPPPRPSRVPDAGAGESPAVIAARAAAALENQREAQTPAAPSHEVVAAPAGVAPPEANAAPTAEPAAATEESPSARQQQTLAYSAQRADALRREYESARARAALASEDRERAARSNLRSLPPLGRGPGSSIPPAPKLDRLVSARLPRAAGEVQLVPAFARDVEPTPRSPITYRERAFLVTPAGDLSNLEGLLQAELLKLREELASAPRGQLIHLAAFDKPLRDAPNAPPVATLEWSDWRGNAVFVSNAEGASSPSLAGPAPSEAATPGDIPAPGSHVAPIPRATRPSDAFVPAESPPPAASTQSVEPPAIAKSTPPPAEKSDAPRARPSSLPAKSGRSPWDKLRAAASETGETPSVRLPQHPLPELAAAEAASTVASPVAPAAPVAPAMPWMNAPPPVAPAAIPSAFQTDSHKAVLDDTGEVDGRLAQAFEALPDLYFLPTPVAGLEFATQLLSRLVPCEAMSVCLYDINTDEFRFVAVGGPGANERRASAVPSQAGLFGAAKWSVEDALLINDVASDARYQPAIDGRSELEILNLAYVPLRHGSQLLGMMQLINRGGDRGFTKSDVAVLHYVSNQLGEFLATRRSLVG
ncbi:MAG TPA: GAF domain-containing protein [Polyangiales bacterium]|nr:GAF domain-containing protein [Polyangiales bacterium]